MNLHVSTYRAALHLIVLWGALVFTLFGSGEGYRACAYLNVIFVALACIELIRKNEPIPWHTLAVASLFPVAFVGLHLLAGGAVFGDKYVQKILLVTINLYALLLLNRMTPTLKLDYFQWPLIFIISIFAIGQFLAFETKDLYHSPSWNYGTLNNPHHLALFIILTIPFMLYTIMSKTGYTKAWMLFLFFLEAYLLLKTSSRPAWLALFVSGLLMYPFLINKQRHWYLMGLLLFPLALYIGGPAEFHDRVWDLIANIGTEERVGIWSNSWHLQQTSTLAEWLIGHGFLHYSADLHTYVDHQGIDALVFPHPHNFVLEILYSSGIVGLGLAVSMYFLLFRTLVMASMYSPDRSRRQLALVVLATAIAHFIHTFLTVPFFSHYNLYILSLLFGARQYLSRKDAM